MPNKIKVSEELNQLIQSLKKTQINKKKTTRNKKTMIGGTHEEVMSGDFSVVTADKIDLSNCKYSSWTSKFYNNNLNVVYKIMTDKEAFEKELKIAENLEKKLRMK